jgi:hypothetical protein
VNIGLAEIRLLDVNLAEVDTWTGFLVPQWIGGLPNVNSACPYYLQVEGMHDPRPGHPWNMLHALEAGDLEKEVWAALIRFDDAEAVA